MQRIDERARSAIDFLKSPLGAFALTIVSLILGIYSTWYNDKTTELSVAELLSSDVLTEHASVPALELNFQGKTLDPRKTPLKVALVRIWNSGDTTIRQPDYDTTTPVGFRVENSTVLWLSVENATNLYLSTNAKPRLSKENEIVIAPVILEPKDVIVIKLLALQQQAGKMSIKPFGKIAGAPEITERLTIRHPAGYIEAFRTPSEDKWNRYFAALIIGAAILNLLAVLVRDWIIKLKARRANSKNS